jgi:tetratricopeptide (TPR) repeat protein
MAWMNFFTGATPAELEARGDRLMASGQWGQAKLTYERARAKLEKTAAVPAERFRALEGKIQQAREALARQHRDTALDYIDGGYVQEAREHLQLAVDMTRDPGLESQLTAALAALEASGGPSEGTLQTAQETTPMPEGLLDDVPAATPHEQFDALCNTLPDEAAAAYRGYDENFRAGYVALNNGDFERAVLLLERALATAPGDAAPGMDTYIPLELATAYLNLGRRTEARRLLETFHRMHPEVLPACELLCTIYGETEDFDRAEALLDALPAGLAQSRAGILLRGETLQRAGRFDAARSVYRGLLTAYGWDAEAARELAKVHEALNEPSEARRLYGEIIDGGRTCCGAIDPLVRQRYAELCFAEGDRSDALLDLYLALAKDAPEQAATCFERISRIYAARHNAVESERFRTFARRARAERYGASPP